MEGCNVDDCEWLRPSTAHLYLGLVICFCIFLSYIFVTLPFFYFNTAMNNTHRYGGIILNTLFVLLVWERYWQPNMKLISKRS